MSFLDNWRMTVKEDSCDICIDEIEKEENIKKRRESIRRRCNEEKYKTQLRVELNIEVRDRCKSICFVFLADCGGDGFSLCKKHLQEVLDVM